MRYIHTIVPSEFIPFLFACCDRDEHLPFENRWFSSAWYPCAFFNPKTICALPPTYHLLIKFNVFCIKPKTPFIYLWQKACGDVVQHRSRNPHSLIVRCMAAVIRVGMYFIGVYILCSKSILHVYNSKWEPGERGTTAARDRLDLVNFAESWTNFRIKYAHMCGHTNTVSAQVNEQKRCHRFRIVK